VGGGSGSRAAARFAAGKSSAGGGGEDGLGRGSAAAKPLRRSAWVQNAEGAVPGCWLLVAVLLPTRQRICLPRLHLPAPLAQGHQAAVTVSAAVASPTCPACFLQRRSASATSVGAAFGPAGGCCCRGPTDES
jgi:hypothetical protein